MKSALVFVCLTIVVTLVAPAAAKGGGGRSGGRSFGRSGSSGRSSSKSSGGGWSWFGGSSKTSSGSSSKNSRSGNSYHSNGVANSKTAKTGGFFSGFMHNTPYHYTPIYINRGHYTHYSDNTYGSDYGGYQQRNTADKNIANVEETSDKTLVDEENYAVGYAASKALSNDFFSIFGMVHEISKYPAKLQNKEASSKITTTTTNAPIYATPLSTTTTPTLISTTMPTTVAVAGPPDTPHNSDLFSRNEEFSPGYLSPPDSLNELLGSTDHQSESKLLALVDKLAKSPALQSDYISTTEHSTNEYPEFDIGLKLPEQLDKYINDMMGRSSLY